MEELTDRALRCWVFGHRWPLDPTVRPFAWNRWRAGLVILRCSGCGSTRRDVVPPPGNPAYDQGDIWARSYEYADNYLLAFPASRRDLRREWYSRHPIPAAAA